MKDLIIDAMQDIEFPQWCVTPEQQWEYAEKQVTENLQEAGEFYGQCEAEREPE